MSAVVVVAGMGAFAISRDLRWGWPAVAVLAILGVRVFMTVAGANRAVFKLGGRLRSRQESKGAGEGSGDSGVQSQ